MKYLVEGRLLCGYVTTKLYSFAVVEICFLVSIFFSFASTAASMPIVILLLVCLFAIYSYVDRGGKSNLTFRLLAMPILVSFLPNPQKRAESQLK